MLSRSTRWPTSKSIDSSRPSNDAHVSLDYFHIGPPGKVLPHGEIDKNWFSIGYCKSLTFDPGFKALPSFERDEFDPTFVRAIADDWYEVAC
jgi:hypothetical protein